MHNTTALLRGLGAVFLMAVIEYRQLDFQLVIGNFGMVHARAEVILYGILTILFGIFITAQVYKIQCFGIAQKDVPQSTKGMLGGILGLLTVGCPACSITLASFLGLAAVFAALPLKGLEVKMLGIVLLCRVNYTMIKTLHTCKRAKNI